MKLFNYLKSSSVVIPLFRSLFSVIDVFNRNDELSQPIYGHFVLPAEVHQVRQFDGCLIFRAGGEGA